MSRIRFQTHLSDAYNLTKSVAGNQKAYSFLDVHKYFARQEKFANTHELYDWLIEIWLLRALMYHVEGNAEEARCLMQPTLEAAAPRGYFRIFLDEADLLRPLLESTLQHSKDRDMSAYIKSLLEAMPGESADKRKATDDSILSDRELDVLRLLAAGKSYNEIGQGLFLSLNTVQFHVKSIYRKLAVNKRTLAIEKARELRLL